MGSANGASFGSRKTSPQNEGILAMNKKILSTEAFSYYWGLGPDRSYQAVAEKFEVSKKVITNLALKENWQKRIAEIERKAQEATDKKMVESLEETFIINVFIRGSHLKQVYTTT